MAAPRFLAALASALVFTSSIAHGQPDVPDDEIASSVIAARAAAAERQLTSDAAAALASYDALRAELYDREQYTEAASLGCRTGVARLRAQHPLEDAVRMAVHDLGSGLAVAETEPARRACLEAGALALVEAAQRRAGAEGAPADLVDELWFRAATWVRRARASGDSAALRAAHDAVPVAMRSELDRLGSLALDAPDAAGLARSVARARYLADPTQIGDCSVDQDGADEGVGAIDCYATQLPERGWGAEYPHASIYFLERPDDVRAIGSAPRMPGYDCETGTLRETVRFARLTRARHGIDGTLRVMHEGGDDLAGWADVETIADVCDAELRACRSFRIGRRHCHPDDRDRPVCSERWEATVQARRGVITLHARRGRLPPDQPTSLPIATLFAGASSAPGARGEREASGRCRAEISDPRPPLNVRAGPDPQSVIAGMLPNGTEVRPRERRRGWVRIDRPLAGWIWARNLRRVCD